MAGVCKVTCEVLEIVNQSISGMLFDATLARWCKEEKHLLFVTDFTPYVTKIAEVLTTTLPQNGPNYMSCCMVCIE